MLRLSIKQGLLIGWLLRSRAIENQCYVVAAAQWGEYQSNYRTFGHSVIIDPWGQVLDELEDGNGVVCAEFAPSYLAMFGNNCLHWHIGDYPIKK